MITMLTTPNTILIIIIILCMAELTPEKNPTYQLDLNIVTFIDTSIVTNTNDY